MSEASDSQVLKFYDVARGDLDILKKLSEGNPTADEIVARASAEAALLGIKFTPAEGKAWVETQAARAKDDELTDVQLEEVAGGKSGYAMGWEIFGKNLGQTLSFGAYDPHFGYGPGGTAGGRRR